MARIPANATAVFDFQFEGRVHQPPTRIQHTFRYDSESSAHTSWGPDRFRVGIPSTSALRLYPSAFLNNRTVFCTRHNYVVLGVGGGE